MQSSGVKYQKQRRRKKCGRAAGIDIRFRRECRVEEEQQQGQVLDTGEDEEEGEQQGQILDTEQDEKKRERSRVRYQMQGWMKKIWRAAGLDIICRR